MTDDILDIAKWEQKYPFLKEIWKKYKFEEDLNEARDSNHLFSICDDNSLYKETLTDIQKHACRKLLKNWHFLRSTEKKMGVHLDWCHNINNWIYYEINPYILNDDIINSILGKAQPMLSSMSNEHYCTFTALNKNHEPKELNKLRIFNDNTSTFQDILRNKSDGYYCSCRNFVKDCINIYQKINGIHCSTATDKNKNNKPTCDIVNLFDIHYRGYLYGDVRIQEKLPDLSSTTNINIEECRSQTNEKGLDSVRGYQSDGSALSTTPTEPSGKTMPTAIGTIVGVSSVLGLLYKFSPAGTWMHSGLRGNGKMIHTNLYADGERELLTDGPLMENLNSYNIGYEVA